MQPDHHLVGQAEAAEGGVLHLLHPLGQVQLRREHCPCLREFAVTATVPIGTSTCPSGRGLHGHPQRLLSPGHEVQEETHTAVPCLLLQGRLPQGCPEILNGI